jgi:hypothetical protein
MVLVLLAQYVGAISIMLVLQAASQYVRITSMMLRSRQTGRIVMQ